MAQQEVPHLDPLVKADEETEDQAGDVDEGPGNREEGRLASRDRGNSVRHEDEQQDTRTQLQEGGTSTGIRQ